jgi:hypothetical protein
VETVVAATGSDPLCADDLLYCRAYAVRKGARKAAADRDRLTPAERNAQERSKAERERRNTDMCENYVTEGQRAAAKKLIGLHGYDCRTIDQMCPYIMSEGFQVACNDCRYLFELENHGGIWSVKAD